MNVVQKSDREDALPWSLIGAGISAMTALYFTRGRFNGLPILAVALVMSRIIPWRLPNTRVISWGLRLVILTVVLLLFRSNPTSDTTVWYLNDYDTKIAGYAVVVELVLRAWERPAQNRARESRGVALLVIALIFTAATHTYEREAIQRITPFFMLFTLLALRSFAQMGQPPRRARSWRSGLVAMRTMVLLMSLGVALAATSLVTRYEYQVTSWAADLINRKHAQAAEIGFSMDVRLGEVSNPSASMDRVLLIDGPQTEQHLRVMAFDSYASPRWLPTMGDRSFEPAKLKTVASTQPFQPLRFRRMSDLADMLPLPLEAQQIEVQGPLEEDDLATVRDQQANASTPYDVVLSSLPGFQGPLSTPPNPQMRERLLEVPAEIDAKVVALAKQIAGTGRPAEQIARIQIHLRNRHQYSLSFTPHGEPLNDFILNNRAAHCQYFASAAVMMARAVGIPARLATGFYAHEQYGSNQMVVRSRDAHAWAECWIDGVGWMTVDATPSWGRPDAEYKDPPAWKRWWEKLTDLPGKITTWFTTQGTAAKTAAIAILAIMLFGWILLKTLRKRRQPKSKPEGYTPPSQDVAALAKRFERWLSKRRHACPPELTWRDHVAATTPTSAMFIQLYNQARFGGDGSVIPQAKELLQKIETEPDPPD